MNQYIVKLTVKENHLNDILNMHNVEIISHYKRGLPKEYFTNEKVKFMINLICENFNTSFLDVLKQDRNEKVLLTRQVAIYLLRKYTKKSYTELGKLFERNHATCIHSVKVIKNYLDVDKQLIYKIKDIETQIQQYISNV